MDDGPKMKTGWVQRNTFEADEEIVDRRRASVVKEEGNCWTGCMDVAYDRRNVSIYCNCRRSGTSIVILGVISWLLNTITLAADWYKYYTVVLQKDYGIFISKSGSVDKSIIAVCFMGSLVYLLGLALMIVQWRRVCTTCSLRKEKQVEFRVAASDMPTPARHETSEGVVLFFRIVMNFLAVIFEDLPMCLIYQSYIVPCTLYWTDWIHLGALAVSPLCLLIKIILTLFLMGCLCSTPVEQGDMKKKRRGRGGYVDDDDVSSSYSCASGSLGCVNFCFTCVAGVALVFGIMVLSDVIPNYTAGQLGVKMYPKRHYEMQILTYSDFNGTHVYYANVAPQPFSGNTEDIPTSVAVFDVRNITPGVDQIIHIPCKDLVRINELGAGEISCSPVDCTVTVVFGYRKHRPNTIVYDYEEDDSWQCSGHSEHNGTWSRKFKDYRYYAAYISKINFLPTTWPVCLRPQRDTTLIQD